MAVQFYQSSQFEHIRSEIEQHLYDSVLEIEQDFEAALRSVDEFAKAIDQLLNILEQMYQTVQAQDIVGEKSFPIREGRYRVFFKVAPKPNDDFEITLLDIDDNMQSNLDRFPAHRLITFDSDET